MSGDISVPECVDVFDAYVNHPLFDPGYIFLTETRTLKRVDANFRSMMMAIQRSMPLIRRFPGRTLAVIHAPQDQNFGMSRMLQQLVEPVSRFRLMIQREETAALACARQPETSFLDLERALGLHTPR